ncbi:MAG: metallophosphoesterase [Lachnospiraceae bacterium]|nr:metallophosphoesterase [Lachnospiraceae bacterium]
MTEWFLILACTVLGLAVFFLVVMVIDGNRYKAVSYELYSRKIKEPYRFVLLADLHDRCYGKNNEKLIEDIRKFNPDVVFMAGDMMTAKTGCSYHNALHLCRELTRDYPVYYSMGNHESRLFARTESYGHLWEAFERELLQTGVILLRNRGESRQDGLSVSGLEIDWQFYRHFKQEPMPEEYLPETLGVPDKEKYQILLAHNPDYFEDYARWGADLVLAGHVHGGIMRLPFLGGVINPALRLFPRYDGGLFHQKDSVMILSRGLGMHTLPVRIFNPGELVLISLKPEGHKEEEDGSVR